MKVLKSFVIDDDVARSLPKLAGEKSMSGYITDLLRDEIRKLNSPEVE